MVIFIVSLDVVVELVFIEESFLLVLLVVLLLLLVFEEVFEALLLFLSEVLKIPIFSGIGLSLVTEGNMYLATCINH